MGSARRMTASLIGSIPGVESALNVHRTATLLGAQAERTIEHLPRW